MADSPSFSVRKLLNNAQRAGVPLRGRHGGVRHAVPAQQPTMAFATQGSIRQSRDYQLPPEEPGLSLAMLDSNARELMCWKQYLRFAHEYLPLFSAQESLLKPGKAYLLVRQGEYRRGYRRSEAPVLIAEHDLTQLKPPTRSSPAFMDTCSAELFFDHVIAKMGMNKYGLFGDVLVSAPAHEGKVAWVQGKTLSSGSGSTHADILKECFGEKKLAELMAEQAGWRILADHTGLFAPLKADRDVDYMPAVRKSCGEIRSPSQI